MAEGRRSYGTGSLAKEPKHPRPGQRQKWVAQWWAGPGQKTKCRLGWVRGDGERDGLTKTQAEAELRRRMSAAPAARPTVGERLTVAEVGCRYLRHLEMTGRKRSTIAAVRGHLAHWLEPFFAERTLDRIRAEDVEDLVALMLNGQRPSGLNRTKPLAPKTIRNVVSTLSALLAYAQRKRWASHNPIEEVELPAVVASEEIRFLEPVEVDAVAAAAIPGPYQAVDRALYITAAMTGLREGELIALRLGDVDWTAGRIRVRRNYVLGAYDTPKSRRSSRSVPMADDVAGELDRLVKVTGATDDAALVFPDPVTGGPLGKPGILRRFRAALAAARLDDTHRFHDLRHTFGTRMAAEGVAMRTLQEWMGHRDLATTQRYADYAPAPDHERELIARAFGRGGIRGGNLSASHITSDDANPAVVSDLA